MADDLVPDDIIKARLLQTLTIHGLPSTTLDNCRLAEALWMAVRPHLAVTAPGAEAAERARRKIENVSGIVTSIRSATVDLQRELDLALCALRAPAIDEAIAPYGAQWNSHVAMPGPDQSLGSDRSLGRAVVRRRTELRLTQEQIAERGGPSVATLRTIEGDHATAYRPKTLVWLNRVLGWEPGTAESMLPAANLSTDAP